MMNTFTFELDQNLGQRPWGDYIRNDAHLEGLVRAQTHAGGMTAVYPEIAPRSATVKSHMGEC
jgi:hypothetical protein